MDTPLRALWDSREDLPANAAEQVLESLDPNVEWTDRLHAVRLVPMIGWSAEDRLVAIERLFLLAQGTNLFVRAWSLDSLAYLSEGSDELRERLLPLLEEGISSGSGAVRARVNAALRRLG